MTVQQPKNQCWCETCRPVTMDDMRMVLCPECGNKRCPKATSHANTCTGSNEAGQKGSSWERVNPSKQVLEKIEPLTAVQEDAINTLRAAIAKAEKPQKAGWQLVPIEPTHEMLESVDSEAEDKYIARGRAVSAWKSMLAAAPVIEVKKQEPFGYVAITGHGALFSHTLSPAMDALEFNGKKYWMPVYTKGQHE